VIRPLPADPRPIRQATAAFLVYGALTAALMWPLVRDPAGTLIRNDDVYGNAWAMAWVVHQATRNPLDLFEANSFYPRPSSFAYTEPLLPIAVQGAPILLAGGSPILAHNAVLLLSFPLAGLGMFLLVRDRTGSAAAAFFAGLAYAFSAYRFQHLVHVQSLATPWLPLAVLFLLRVLESGRRREAALAALFALLQVLSSGYYAVMTALGLGTVLALEGPRAYRSGASSSRDRRALDRRPDRAARLPALWDRGVAPGGRARTRRAQGPG
jgi:hypothetical protein